MNAVDRAPVPVRQGHAAALRRERKEDSTETELRAVVGVLEHGPVHLVELPGIGSRDGRRRRVVSRAGAPPDRPRLTRAAGRNQQNEEESRGRHEHPHALLTRPARKWFPHAVDTPPRASRSPPVEDAAEEVC